MMKKCLLGAAIAAIVFLAQNTYADELVQMNNGMTCWRNNVGFMYGCSGGTQTGDSGFNEVRTGRRYENINENQAIDTRTGQLINNPNRERNDNNERR